MDFTRFKQTRTQRGFLYSYYFSAPAPSSKPLPTILFLHGFPTPAYLWHAQISAFEARGFGIVAPDMLGYGGTDKPSEVGAYVGSGLARDVVDILDGEGVGRVVAVGHDWGARVVSRLINYHPSRLLGTALLAVPYFPPRRTANSAARDAMIKKLLGYDAFAYQRFFGESDACGLMERNDKEYYRKTLLEGGLEAPLAWYKAATSEASLEDDAKISESAALITNPHLFIGFSKDPVCRPEFGASSHAPYVRPPSNLTNKVVEGDHWALLSHAEEVNGILLEWVEGVIAKCE
ncbi:Esterase/Lipase [Mycena chlorophos]|uniref:Esterase/Lipase n=1 Tax=Mycena chlorophos TaxID=658473 RepID=A0A8H6WN17_MYCCL|nr:Esterase/Lipase [Mycena chlorophos]